MALDDSRSKSLSLWKKAALFGAAYFFCAEAGSYLSVRNSTYVSFWLPAGLTTAVLLLNRTRDWPWLLLAAFPANFAFDFVHDPKPNFTLVFLFYCSNVFQGAVGAWLVRKFIAERPTLATLKEFFGIVFFAAMFSAMLGAVIGAGTLVHFGFSKSFEQSWKVWWGSTAMAVLVLTPFILTWFSKPNRTRNYFDRPNRIAEASLLLLGLGSFAWYLLTSDKGVMSPNKSVLIPLLLWAGLRFGVRGATAATLFLSVTLAFFTAQFFYGLTPSQIASGEYVFVMQMALAMASLMALIPAIVVGERERTLDELRESEERFKNLSAAAFEGICISENGRILDINDQGLKMFGYERSEMIGKQIIELVAPESRALVTEAIRTGSETIYGHQLQRKDGSVFSAEAQAQMVRAGNQTLRMTALRDITERKRAEEALRNSEALFRSYFELAMVGCAVTSLEKGMLAVNDQFCQMLDYSREELAKMTWAQLTHPDDVAADVAEFNRLLAGEIDSYTLDKRFLRKDGREIFATIAIRCVRHTDGSPDYIVGMAMDITERKRAEADRAEAQSRESQARAEYTFQLIASQEAERARIARELHDSLGQNLLLVKNRAQLALAKQNSPSNLHEQMEDINRLAEQAIAEVRQISHDLHPYQLDHLGLTRAIEAMINNAAQATGLAFNRKLDLVDDVFLKDAAINLYRIVQESLNNILKHSHAKRASITLERDVHEVQLRIEDDGDGFKAGQKDEGGKGLGLKNIAERVRILGGKIEVDSQPDKGTRIEISIPISTQHG
jgi:two-component system sensor histidine kinase UhpB